MHASDIKKEDYLGAVRMGLRESFNENIVVVDLGIGEEFIAACAEQDGDDPHNDRVFANLKVGIGINGENPPRGDMADYARFVLDSWDKAGNQIKAFIMRSYLEAYPDTLEGVALEAAERDYDDCAEGRKNHLIFDFKDCVQFSQGLPAIRGNERQKQEIRPGLEVTVFNPTLDKEWTFVGLTPAQALVATVEKEDLGNGNTWSYQDSDLCPIIGPSGKTVLLGDYAAKINHMDLNDITTIQHGHISANGFYRLWSKDNGVPPDQRAEMDYWFHIPSGQEPYTDVKANPEQRKIITYCEGDFRDESAPSEESFRRALYEAVKFYIRIAGVGAMPDIDQKLMDYAPELSQIFLENGMSEDQDDAHRLSPVMG